MAAMPAGALGNLFALGYDCSMAKLCFPPVCDERTCVIILGSLPGEISLAAGQYYANPRNQFWRLTGAVIGIALCGRTYEARLQTLLYHRIGLWDVVRSAHREGSLDTAIQDCEPNALGAFAASHANLRAIAFNGNKAAQIGGKQLPVGFEPAIVTLPSSSPANTMSFDRKLEHWMALKHFL
jgi:hypoxanthine-DNA glycosylase